MSPGDDWGSGVGSGVSFRRSLKVNLPLTLAVADIWGFLLVSSH